MATMYPEVYIPDPSLKLPKGQRDGEEVVFNILNKSLPPQYHVFHGSRKYRVNNANELEEKETDFIIYNREKGIICLEVKNALFHYEPDYINKNGYREPSWIFNKKYDKNRNGDTIRKKMPHKGPWHQAKMEAKSLRDTISENENTSGIKCKILYAVWSLQTNYEATKNLAWPLDADRNLTFFQEDEFKAPEEIKAKFDSIYDLTIKIEDTGDIVQNKISEEEERILFSEILNIRFKMCDSRAYRNQISRKKAIQYLRQQQQVLDFTTLQQYVAINGAAGTGKTLIAVKKAEMLAKTCTNNEKVLFLCLNRELHDYLQDRYSMDKVEYKMISKFISEDLCKGYVPNTKEEKYSIAETTLIEVSEGQYELPYKHYIIDECQDFSNPELSKETEFLQLLCDALKGQYSDGCFYVFYDELQLVNGAKKNGLPSYILESDAKVSLATNCRNTKNIALASLKPMLINYKNIIETSIEKEVSEMNISLDKKEKLVDIKKKILANRIKNRQTNVLGYETRNSSTVNMYFTDTKDEIKNTVDEIINIYLAEKDARGNLLHKADDIIILTAKSIEKSIYKRENQQYPGTFELSKWRYTGESIKFRTTSQFKGLEKPYVILIEVDKETFKDDPMAYYVGTSRAMKDLTVVSTLTEDDCEDLVKNWLKTSKDKRTYRMTFASEMKCTAK